MATGFSVTSIFKSSDELYEFCCSVCAENSITKEARTYCKDCAEYLCEECLKHHSKFPRMRSHVITDTSGQTGDSQMPTAESKTDLPKCTVHHGNVVTFLCIQHDEFCCQSCIALKHRSCSSTIAISQAAKNIKNSTEYQTKVTALSEVLTSLQDAKSKTQNNLKNCKSEKESVLENVNEYEKQLHALVDEISQKTKDWIRMKYEDIETKFGNHISTLETVITSTEQSLQNVTSENEVRSFVYMRSCTDFVDGCHELLQEIALHTDRKPLSFSLNKDIINTFVQHEALLKEDEQYLIGEVRNETIEMDDKSFTTVYQNTSTERTDQTDLGHDYENTYGQRPQEHMPFVPHPAYGHMRFGHPGPKYQHQDQTSCQNQPNSQSSKNFPKDQSHMRGPFPYNVPIPGYPMYHPIGMPQGGNKPFHPRMMQMPMIFDQHSGQFVPLSSAGMPSAPPMSPLDSSKGSADETRDMHSDPRSPYTSLIHGYSKPTVTTQMITCESTGDAQPDKESPVSQDTEDKRGESDATVERPTKILVSKLPPSAHEDFLELFFENKKKYGGGPVFHIEFDEENASAVIEFEDPDAVDRVLTKCPITMMGQELNVQIYVPEPPPPRCTIEVTGPSDVVCEDHLALLEMYFEKKSSGGGAVVEAVFDADKNMALFTFESENVAMRVVERGNHLVKRQNIIVNLHAPETKQKEDAAGMYEEEQPLRTVKIKGVDKAACRDTLEFYFENERKSAGGEIDTVKSDEEEDDVLYITFKNTEAAKRVAEREHVVENQILRVVLFEPPKPPPCYDDRVLVKGLNRSTTQDCLFKFIEANTEFIPKTIDFHAEVEGVAMITFQIGHDETELYFDKLKSVLSKRKLEGAWLKIERVPISNCILVTNLPSDFTKDTVEFYFENVRKSGGGQVQKVVMNDDESCLVFFQDYSVVDSVMQRQHSLDHQTLKVMKFQVCLSKPEGGLADRKRIPDGLRIPDAIFIDTDPSKIKFMKASKAYKEAIEAGLGTCNAAVVLQQQHEHVMLQCTITSETQNCYELVKTWREEAQKHFEDYMQLITVHKMPILLEVWQKVIDRLKHVTIDNPDDVALFVDRSDGIVTIAGFKPVSDLLAKQVNDIAIKVLEEAKREKQKEKYFSKKWWGEFKGETKM